MNRAAKGALVGLVASLPAAILTVALYLYLVLGAPIVIAAKDGSGVALPLLPVGCVLGVIAGLIVSALDPLARPVRGRSVVGAALFAGALFGLFAAHGSPHVSPTFAAASGIGAWVTIGVLVLAISRIGASAA